MSKELEPKNIPIPKNRSKTAIHLGMAAAVGITGASTALDALSVHAQDPQKDKKIESYLPQGLPSEVAFKEKVTVTPTATPIPRTETKQIVKTTSTEIKAQAVENPIYFIDSLGRQRKWEGDNARFGIPPNNPDKPAGTVDDSINNSYAYSFQTKNSLYKEITDGSAIRTVIGGLTVDISTGKGYMATGVDVNSVFYPRIELISNINNPADYSDGARVLFKDGIDGVGQKGDYDSFYMGGDSQGKYLDLVFTHSVDPAKNGTYRLRLDNQGNFQGSFFKVIDTPTPTPTATNSPTPTPTFKVFGFNVYMPLAMKQKSGGW